VAVRGAVASSRSASGAAGGSRWTCRQSRPLSRRSEASRVSRPSHHPSVRCFGVAADAASTRVTSAGTSPRTGASTARRTRWPRTSPRRTPQCRDRSVGRAACPCPGRRGRSGPALRWRPCSDIAADASRGFARLRRASAPAGYAPDGGSGRCRRQLWPASCGPFAPSRRESAARAPGCGRVPAPARASFRQAGMPAPLVPVRADRAWPPVSRGSAPALRPRGVASGRASGPVRHGWLPVGVASRAPSSEGWIG
jgi:hypothetical protein